MHRIILAGIILIAGLFSFMTTDAQFRVVGYIHPHIGGNESEKIDFEKITHLNIAFVNPDSLGNLLLPPGLTR